MRRIILLAALVSIFSSCKILGGKRVRGNGTIITQDRQVNNFNSLDVRGAVSVLLKQAPAATVRVETDENLMQYLDIKVDGNTLVIEPRRGYNLDPSKEITVYVSASRFNDIDVSGASKISSEQIITGEEMTVHASGASEIMMEVKFSKLASELSGASTLILKGDARQFSIDASGASKIRCLDLKTEEAKLDISGATEAAIYADKELNIEASGASQVEYRGNANINQKSSGASIVRKV